MIELQKLSMGELIFSAMDVSYEIYTGLRPLYRKESSLRPLYRKKSGLRPLYRKIVKSQTTVQKNRPQTTVQKNSQASDHCTGK